MRGLILAGCLYPTTLVLSTQLLALFDKPIIHYPRLSLLQASQYVEVLEQRQGLRNARPQELAYRFGYVSLDRLYQRVKRTSKSGYGTHLMSVCESSRETALASS